MGGISFFFLLKIYIFLFNIGENFGKSYVNICIIKKIHNSVIMSFTGLVYIAVDNTPSTRLPIYWLLNPTSFVPCGCGSALFVVQTLQQNALVVTSGGSFGLC
jgi:hypothetical protein